MADRRPLAARGPRRRWPLAARRAGHRPREHGRDHRLPRDAGAPLRGDGLPHLSSAAGRRAGRGPRPARPVLAPPSGAGRPLLRHDPQAVPAVGLSDHGPAVRHAAPGRGGAALALGGGEHVPRLPAGQRRAHHQRSLSRSGGSVPARIPGRRRPAGRAAGQRDRVLRHRLDAVARPAPVPSRLRGAGFPPLLARPARALRGAVLGGPAPGHPGHRRGLARRRPGGDARARALLPPVGHPAGPVPARVRGPEGLAGAGGGGGRGGCRPGRRRRLAGQPRRPSRLLRGHLRDLPGHAGRLRGWPVVSARQHERHAVPGPRHGSHRRAPGQRRLAGGPDRGCPGRRRRPITPLRRAGGVAAAHEPHQRGDLDLPVPAGGRAAVAGPAGR